MSEPIKYLSVFKDRHGRRRAYFRPPNAAAVPLPLPEDPRFMARYRAVTRAYQSGELTRSPTKQEVSWSARRLSAAMRQATSAEGVYLLIDAGEVVYVGTSKNCAERVAKHRQNGRRFETWLYIYASEEDRYAVEAMLIRQMRPSGNRTEPVVTQPFLQTLSDKP